MSAAYPLGKSDNSPGPLCGRYRTTFGWFAAGGAAHRPEQVAVTGRSRFCPARRPRRARVSVEAGRPVDGSERSYVRYTDARGQRQAT
ncbi:MAG: hypothetical protein NVS3B26_21930 [Mycobacteriales bacterium]